MSNAELIAEAREIHEEVGAYFGEGWCVCRSSSLPGKLLDVGDRLADALEAATRMPITDGPPDYKALANNIPALVAHAEMIADGQATDGMKGNPLAMEIANILTLLNDALAPRVVSTVAELDALPNGTVVLDSEPSVMYRNYDNGKWWVPGSPRSFDSEDAILPATVLAVGGTE